MEGNGGSNRNTTAILQGALQDLYERRDKLAPFVKELKDVEAGIKTVEKAIEGRNKRAKGTTGHTAGTSKRDLILEAIESSIDPLDNAQIAEKIGGGRGMAPVLAALEREGKIVKADGGWGKAIPHAATME